MKLRISGILVAIAICVAGAAQAQSVSVDDVTCLPKNGHGIGIARESGFSGDATLRLFYRRMHDEVEDFYWSPMVQEGDLYWGLFPDPEDRELVARTLNDGQETLSEWADWWKAKEASADRDPNGDLDVELIRERASVGKQESRDWMNTMDADDLQAFLDALENEPAEFYVAVFSPNGEELGKTAMKVTEVSPTCDKELTQDQEEASKDLTIGETGSWMQGKGPFHWECRHIVARVDPSGVQREDDVCLVPIIAWWPAAIVAGGAVGGVIVEPTEPEPPPAVSASEPPLF